MSVQPIFGLGPIRSDPIQKSLTGLALDGRILYTNFRCPQTLDLTMTQLTLLPYTHSRDSLPYDVEFFSRALINDERNSLAFSGGVKRAEPAEIRANGLQRSVVVRAILAISTG